MASSHTLLRYVKLLKERVNRLPKELYEILGLDPTEYAVDFVRLMYIHQLFYPVDDGSKSLIKGEILDLMTRYRNITILGGAGSGKTTTLKFIVDELCNNFQRADSLDGRALLNTSVSLEKARQEIQTVRANLALIEERITEYPLSMEVPLSLIKERGNLQRKLASLTQVVSTTIDVNQSDTSVTPLIPILIQLGELSGYLNENLDSDIDFQDLLAHKFGVDFRTLPDLHQELLPYLEDGEACILIDGLDELEEGPRQKIAGILTRLAVMYPSRIILSSRPHAYVQHLNGFATIEIDTFHPEQIDDYLVRWYSAVYTKLGTLFERRLYAWNLYNKIKAGGLLEVARSPLILTQIVILHKSEADLSLGNVRILQKILRLLLFRWRSGLYVSYQKFVTLRSQVKISDDELLVLVGAIAFQMLHSQCSHSPLTATLPTVIKWIEEGLIDLEIEKQDAAEIIVEYLQNCDRLLEVSSNKPPVYRFADVKIQEYLAAYYLLSIKHSAMSYTEQLPALLDNDLECWDSVAIFVCQLLHVNAAKMFVDYLFRRFTAVDTDLRHADKEILCGTLVCNLLSKGYDFQDYSPMLNSLKSRMLAIVGDPSATWQSAISAGDILANMHDERSTIDYMCKAEYWIEISAGSFEMGRGTERHTVALDRYFVAKLPVTNEQYEHFIQEAHYDRVPQNWYEDKPYLIRKNHPVTGLHWTEALDFAEWLNKRIAQALPDIVGSDYAVRLPTEAEWERSALDTQVVVLPRLVPNLQYPAPDRIQFLSDYETWPVGLACLHDTNSAIYDLFNNVWEWTASAYWSYPYNSNDGRNNMAKNLPRVIRGGYIYLEDPFVLRTHRGQCHMYRPVYKMNNVGFRLVIARRLI